MTKLFTYIQGVILGLCVGWLVSTPTYNYLNCTNNVLCMYKCVPLKGKSIRHQMDTRMKVKYNGIQNKREHRAHES